MLLLLREQYHLQRLLRPALSAGTICTYFEFLTMCSHLCCMDLMTGNAWKTVGQVAWEKVWQDNTGSLRPLQISLSKCHSLSESLNMVYNFRGFRSGTLWSLSARSVNLLQAGHTSSR